MPQKNAKQLLHELVGRYPSGEEPSFVSYQVAGEAHCPVFRCDLVAPALMSQEGELMSPAVVTEGFGASKRESEQAAAANALTEWALALERQRATGARPGGQWRPRPRPAAAVLPPGALGSAADFDAALAGALAAAAAAVDASPSNTLGAAGRAEASSAELAASLQALSLAVQPSAAAPFAFPPGSAPSRPPLERRVRGRGERVDSCGVGAGPDRSAALEGPRRGGSGRSPLSGAADRGSTGAPAAVPTPRGVASPASSRSASPAGSTATMARNAKMLVKELFDLLPTSPRPEYLTRWASGPVHGPVYECSLILRIELGDAHLVVSPGAAAAAAAGMPLATLAADASPADGRDPARASSAGGLGAPTSALALPSAAAGLGVSSSAFAPPSAAGGAAPPPSALAVSSSAPRAAAAHAGTSIAPLDPSALLAAAVQASAAAPGAPGASVDPLSAALLAATLAQDQAPHGPLARNPCAAPLSPSQLSSDPRGLFAPGGMVAAGSGGSRKAAEEAAASAAVVAIRRLRWLSLPRSWGGGGHAHAAAGSGSRRGRRGEGQDRAERRGRDHPLREPTGPGDRAWARGDAGLGDRRGRGRGARTAPWAVETERLGQPARLSDRGAAGGGRDSTRQRGTARGGFDAAAQAQAQALSVLAALSSGALQAPGGNALSPEQAALQILAGVALPGGGGASVGLNAQGAFAAPSAGAVAPGSSFGAHGAPSSLAAALPSFASPPTFALVGSDSAGSPSSSTCSSPYGSSGRLSSASHRGGAFRPGADSGRYEVPPLRPASPSPSRAAPLAATVNQSSLLGDDARLWAASRLCRADLASSQASGAEASTATATEARATPIERRPASREAATGLPASLAWTPAALSASLAGTSATLSASLQSQPSTQISTPLSSGSFRDAASPAWLSDAPLVEAVDGTHAPLGGGRGRGSPHTSSAAAGQDTSVPSLSSWSSPFSGSGGAVGGPRGPMLSELLGDDLGRLCLGAEPASPDGFAFARGAAAAAVAAAAPSRAAAASSSALSSQTRSPVASPTTSAPRAIRVESRASSADESATQSPTLSWAVAGAAAGSGRGGSPISRSSGDVSPRRDEPSTVGAALRSLWSAAPTFSAAAGGQRTSGEGF